MSPATDRGGSLSCSETWNPQSGVQYTLAERLIFNNQVGDESPSWLSKRILWYKQPNRCNSNNFINNFKQLNMFRAIISSTLKHRRCCLQAASSVLYTTSCKYCLVLLRMGEIIPRNMLSWLKLLIKLLLLHLVGCLYYCINDARTHKHQIYKRILIFTQAETCRTFRTIRCIIRKYFCDWWPVCLFSYFWTELLCGLGYWCNYS